MQYSLPAEAANKNKALPVAVFDALTNGNSVDLIVEYETQAIETELEAIRQKNALNQDDQAILSIRRDRYLALKKTTDQSISRADIEQITDYSHLPMSVKRFHSNAALNAFLAHSNIKAVYENILLHGVLTESLPLINQPVVASAGEIGAGTTVAVIDDGIDFTNSAFGSCTAPGVPATCKVIVDSNFGSGTTDTTHGTNVSAIVAGVAPGSKIAMLNAFSGSSASASAVISAINWAIANRAAYNIVAINMSLGDSSKNTNQCSAGNPFYTPILNSRAAGMNVVIAAGNNAYTDGLSNPACTPGAISVGAVYDANIGSINWGSTLCSDTNTAADKITCFSNSANYLTLLAPGALITAAGITEGGTSQATPHVAGAIAALRSTYPTETIDQIKTRLTGKGVPITDSRNGITTPRLNLLESARPINDAFSNRFSIAGNNGNSSGLNKLASKEIAEPTLDPTASGNSVWWKWVAPAAGQVSLDTHGSNFDTLLGVYSGTAVNALQFVANNDNDGSSNNNSGLVFQAQAGKEYEFLIDGKNTASGNITLNWTLNTAAKANLSITTTGPAYVMPDSNQTYQISVTNSGPNIATNVIVSINLPTNVSFVSSSGACSATQTTVKCNLADLINGGNTLINLVLNWANNASDASLASSVSSDLPDANTADNQTSFAVNVLTDSEDVPLLPNWGMVLLGGMLVLLQLRFNNRI